MTETWFRNPHNYIRELVECGGPFNIVWDRGMLVKRNINPFAHSVLYMGRNDSWNLLIVGTQGTAHLDYEHDMKNPLAVYPTWEYGEDFRILEEMVSSPIGMDQEACQADVPVDERPVFGQDHRVVITNLPNVNTHANRPFYRTLRELQEEYPECKMTLHGLYSFRVMFGMGFYAADCEPRSGANGGKVYMPTGKEVAFARTVNQQDWVHTMNMSVPDLKVPRNRCIFNIRSMRWAGENFEKNIKPKGVSSGLVDIDSPTTPTLPSSRATFRGNLNTTDAKEGDMVVCDSCSLAENCKLYREGAVCTVRGSDTNSLAKAFNSRSSEKIIGGLGAVLEAQANRLERGMEAEEEFGELDSEVSKALNNLFANGVKLAKLVDPNLTKPLVQINGAGGGQGGDAQISPKERMAQAIRVLEDQGVARKSITPEMVGALLGNMNPQQSEPKVIEGTYE